MQMFTLIRKKTASERMAMLLSLLVHGGLAVGFVYTVHHSSVGGAAYSGASPTTVVNLISAHKDFLPSRVLTSADAGIKDGDLDTRHTQATGAVETLDVLKDQSDLFPQASGWSDVDTASTSNFIVLPKPYYFQPNELTEQPVVVLDVSPDLSAVFSSGLSQLAVLDLLINESGDIDDVVIENSSLAEPAQQLIKDAFSKMKFNPGKVAGLAVKSLLKIEVVLEGGAVENIAKKTE